MNLEQPECNAEILGSVMQYGSVTLPNGRAENFKRWVTSPALKFEYIVKGELTTIKKVK